MSVSYSLMEQDHRDLRFVDDKPGFIDFDSRDKLKKIIKSVFNNYNCPHCHSERTSGYGVIIKYGKINFYRDEEYKGVFGGKKYRDKLYKTVWRLHEVGLRPGVKGGFLASGISPGCVYCKAKGCGWEIQAPTYPRKAKVTWYSMNDIINGKL